MSTRRARIKAVTALPPRRKNIENNEAKKKLITTEEQNVQKSPKTPSRSTPKPEKIHIQRTPTKLSSSVSENKEKQCEVIRAPTPIQKDSTTPKRQERATVITSGSDVKANFFASPYVKNSPSRKYIPSPVLAAQNAENMRRVITPVKDVENVQKRIDENLKSKEKASETPHKVDGTSDTSSAGVRADNHSDVPEDYNVPSVPESITEDAMDGIVPLQSAGSVPKPIDLLKNEIISENAEVLFDPIVPLPSPGKVRPKLRPVPRLGPLRRSSVQGSASESEDESRRLLGGRMTPSVARQRRDSQTSHSTVYSMSNRESIRRRNDSVCSVVSQSTVAHPSSPIKEKNPNKSRRIEVSRRLAQMRRRRESMKRDNLTMYDLIFYNPTSNPIQPDLDEKKAMEANAKAEANVINNKSEDDEDSQTESAPVPQIKLGPNGEIILDEKSLVIKQSRAKSKVVSEVREGKWTRSTSGYRRSARTADWPDDETIRFYRALAAIGTDFTLMQPLFPNRTRKDLKLKFKKEEKLNLSQIEKALRSRVEWNAIGLQEEFAEEREAAARKKEQEKKRLQDEKNKRKEEGRDTRFKKYSKSSQVLETSVKKTDNSTLTADDVIAESVQWKPKRKRKRKPSKQEEESTQDNPQSTTQPSTNVMKNCTDFQRELYDDMATLTRIDPKSGKPGMPMNLKPPVMPSNIETGSLVVLTVNDPNSPAKKMLQTYIARDKGKLTPVNLPPSLLNSVVGYVRKGTPNSHGSGASSPLTSPSSVASIDSRASITPVSFKSSPQRRQRNNSYTITTL